MYLQVALQNEIDRFLSKIEFIPFHSCWEWIAGINPDGYGVFRSKKYQTAHRFSYELYKESILDGMVIDHLCKNKKCVNPNHLRQVTLAVNTTENSNSPSALNKIKKICKMGHLFDLKNTDIRTNKHLKSRRCRKCAALRAKIYRNRKNNEYSD